MKLRAGIDGARAHLDSAAERVPAVEHALRFRTRSTGVGSNLLACAIAYRLFIWMLPTALVLSSLASFGRARASGRIAEDLGLSAYVANQVADQAHPSRWLALVVGLLAMASASIGAVKTMRVVHQL